MSDPFSEMKRCEKGEEHAQHLSLNPNASTESARDKPSAPRSFNFRRAAAAAALVVFGLWSTHTFGATTSHKALSNRISNVEWKGCEALGKEFQCSSVSVPLDYRNAGDERTIKIALTRFLASDQASRKGAIFVNPGGPGGSGTEMVRLAGAGLSRTVKGQYDIVGFDPRGVSTSEPYVSCFKTALEQDAFLQTASLELLNLPANLSAFPSVRDDLARQVDLQSAGVASLAKHCLIRSGEILPYLGTENVVKDIDFLARAIEGSDAPINYWGFSYGTMIGQYMVKILPAERLGRLVLDAVVNPEQWRQHGLHFFDGALQDVDSVLYSFASSCLSAGKNCSLNADAEYNTPASLLTKIDSTIDSLYAHPVPVHGLEVPALATAAHLRKLIFRSMYSIRVWPLLANILQQAFAGNFTEVVRITTSPVQAGDADKSDSSLFATHAIICADAAPYTDVDPPTNADVVDATINRLTRYSSRMGEAEWGILCHKWAEAGLPTTRSRYGGDFSLKNDSLHTPVLLLSNTYDPVTPLANALLANDRLGNNARLIQQVGGLGHAAISHISYCTLSATQEYFLDGKLPAKKHSLCKVDQKPFVPFEAGATSFGEGEVELIEAWSSVSKALRRL